MASEARAGGDAGDRLRLGEDCIGIEIWATFKSFFVCQDASCFISHDIPVVREGKSLLLGLVIGACELNRPQND